MKLRNAANSAWITLFQLDGEWSLIPFENGTAAAPSIYFKDSGTDTGLFSGGTDQVNITTGGTERVEWGTSEVVFNDSGANYDFRIEGDTNGNLFFVDASADAVGIGTSSPSQLFTLNGTGGGSFTGGFTNALARINATTNTAGQGAAIALTAIATKETAWIIAAEHTSGNHGDLAFYAYPGGASYAERLRITAAGNVGIGTASPADGLGYGTALDIRGSGTGNGGVVYLRNSDASVTGFVAAFGDGRMDLGTSTNHPLKFITNSNERARIDSSGRLLVGTSSNSVGSTIVCQGNSGSSTAEAVVRLNRGTAVPTSGQTLGAIVFGQSGSNDGAYILGEADAAWSASNDYPTRLVFSTTADGASSPTERMRISNNGRVNIGNTSTNPVGDNATGFYLLNGSTYLGAGSETVLFVNRKTNDGALISLQQDATEEGSISVSGTTVSYNGAHLSRWSQLPGGIERKEILRGTVLSNIDEMCAWGEEDNEQLNRMKVSDVEGDPNVSGVFQAWDDDDDTYTDDFYCAMTGDFIIRIAQGVTVQRGDLLMSAGDGTAKPQDDDIIRSKTIAKVTSTHVTCTYDDGSYCVPCVLMAC
jgi:hypothetical protein